MRMNSPAFWTRAYWLGAATLVASGAVAFKHVVDSPGAAWHRDAMRITLLAPPAPAPAIPPVPVPETHVEVPPRPVPQEDFAVPEIAAVPPAAHLGSPDAGSAAEGLGMEGDTSPGQDSFGLVGRQPGVTDPNARGSSTGVRGLGGGAGTATIVDPQALERYVIALSKRLSRDQVYPRRAQQDGREGTALVEVLVSADAKIVQVALARSSGVSALDDEALAKLRRLRSLPEPPEEVIGRNFTVIVPIEFKLQ
ncbi:MAG: energy transducer TonB [Betaproteobacteria bacterium]|nr:energy transducer TonB [Betaproteobacteria bacterium]